MTYYYIYKTTNKINNKIYIGVHKTSNLDDGYMGSGTLLKRSIEKYGIDNFKKEIIQQFDTSDEMFEMESQLVNEEFITRNDTYNIKEGGQGGWDFINSNGLNIDPECHRISGYALGDKIHKNPELLIQYRNHMDHARQYVKKYGCSFKGRHHTQETKKKIGEANSKSQSGSGNSQYGMRWIHNIELKESKPVKKDDLDKWINDGWIKGRKMKF